LLRHNNSQKNAIKFLILVAVAPVLGGLLGLFITLPPIVLLAYLGAFAGFLLYIGASDILPEAHSRDSSLKTVFATILGVLFVTIISTFIHH
jgi:ZIP family zinc transporter